MQAESSTPSWARQAVPGSSSGASKAKSSHGTWQGLGVGPALSRALALRGFKNPTPIQRVTLPSTLASPPRDVLGMARTGSGKTLAYMIPLLQRLSGRAAAGRGPKALILCPTRELAMQILKVGKDLGRGIAKEVVGGQHLKWALVMGGDGLEAQFEALSNEPDVIIATPGRLLHVIVEMNLDLKSLDLVIYDEADRLFEMGFEVQLHEILHRLPSTRQNLLFSATLPSAVAEFAKAGLVNPLLLRLDADSKISDDLTLSFFDVKTAMKDAALLALLDNVVGIQANDAPSKDSQQAIIFVSTKHHVEYLTTLLRVAGYRTNHIYGSLDQIARQSQLLGFRNKDADLLVVTDVAARGLDIPIMDNVINYDFPSGVRNFIHRVGRTARAGRKGSAWSFVTREDMPYLIELELFLGTDIISPSSGRHWTIPQSFVDLKVEQIAALSETAQELPTLRSVMERGRTMFERSRTKATSSAHRQAKQSRGPGNPKPPVHPSFSVSVEDDDEKKAQDRLLASLMDFTPVETVFEMGSRGQKGSSDLMNARRLTIAKRKASTRKQTPPADVNAEEPLSGSRPPLEGQKQYKDPNNYIEHTRKSGHGDDGIKDPNFIDQMRSVTFDMNVDEGQSTRVNKASQLKWDRKKKRLVKNEVGADNKKMVRSESGVLLPATYKSGKFEEWRRSRRVSKRDFAQKHSKTEGDSVVKDKVSPKASHSFNAKAGGFRDTKRDNEKPELRSAAAILGARRTAEKRKAKNHRPSRRRT